DRVVGGGHGHEGATAMGFGGHQGVRGGPSARASRQERPSHAGGGGRRSSSGGGGVSREEGRRCRPGARCPRGGRPERGRVAEGAVRGRLRPQPAERVGLGGADHMRMLGTEEELVALLRVLASLSSPGRYARLPLLCATCVSAESVERAQNSAYPLMG
ncbi:unnamed protein product, partial [Ectocarpus sp. 12 AP-2014]